MFSSRRAHLDLLFPIPIFKKCLRCNLNFSIHIGVGAAVFSFSRVIIVMYIVGAVTSISFSSMIRFHSIIPIFDLIPYQHAD